MSDAWIRHQAQRQRPMSASVDRGGPRPLRAVLRSIARTLHAAPPSPRRPVLSQGGELELACRGARQRQSPCGPEPSQRVKAVEVGLRNRPAPEGPGARRRMRRPRSARVRLRREQQRAGSSTPYTLAGLLWGRARAGGGDAFQGTSRPHEPVTARPSLTSSPMTAQPKLRAPNTTALRCSARISLIRSLHSVGVLARSPPLFSR
jgi:hypothetical protein